jgi:hypothetical protein
VLSARDPDSDHVRVPDQDALLAVSYGVGIVSFYGELLDDDDDGDGVCCGDYYYAWSVMGAFGEKVPFRVVFLEQG